MLRVFLGLLMMGTLLVGGAQAADRAGRPSGKVKKVLPHLLDAQGRHTVSPSLFDRDAYQAMLRQHPEEVTGIRYDVRWKAARAAGRLVTIRVELRGLSEERQPWQETLETSVDGRSSIRRWTKLTLSGEAFENAGRVTAWRATLWCDGELLDEYRSFLW